VTNSGCGSLDLVDAGIYSILSTIHPFFSESGFTIFAEIQEKWHYIANQSYSILRMPRVWWQDDRGAEMILDGRLIAMSAFRALYMKLIHNTREMLHDKVLLGLQPPDLSRKHTVDDLSNTDIGYSFIEDPGNDFKREGMFLSRAMTDPKRFKDRFCYHSYSNNNGLSLNHNGIQRWFSDCQTCLGNIFALVHLGSGQPARGTEFGPLTHKNTHLHPRGVFYFEKHIHLVFAYNKTQKNQGKQRVICRTLPPEIEDILMKWLVLVVPTLVAFSHAMHGESGLDITRRFDQQLFTSLRGNWATDDFTSILIHLTAPPVCEGGLGYALTMSEIRHFLIAITRKHCVDSEEKYRVLEEVFNEQSGHSNTVARAIYALEYQTIQSIDPVRLKMFIGMSKLYHTIILDREPSTTTTATTSPSWPPVHQTSPCSLEFSLQDARAVASWLQPDISRSIKEACLEVAAMQNPIHRSPNSIPVDPGTATPAFNPEARFMTVDVENFSIDPTHVRDLRQVFGVSAKFKSKGQAVAVALSAKRDHDLVVILGTGVGKSLLFILSAVRKSEVTMATVVLVPLHELLYELWEKLRKLKISCEIWTTSTSSYTSQVVFVSPEAAQSSEFLKYVRIGYQKNALARFVIEEFHLVQTQAHFRECLPSIGRLREIPVPFVYLSATSPPSDTVKTLETLYCVPENTYLVRESTEKPNIVFSVYKLARDSALPPDRGAPWVHYIGENLEELSLVNYVNSFLSNFQRDDRILVYCLTKQEAKDIAAFLGCQFYISDMTNEEKRNVMTNWKDSGTGNQILVCTSCLGAGLDYQSVRLIIHYHLPRHPIDHSQEVGRGGRDGLPTHATVFWDPGRKIPHTAESRLKFGYDFMREWAQAEQCRRITLGKFLDGHGKSCFELATVELCDLCQKRLKSSEDVCNLCTVRYLTLSNNSLR